MKTSELIKKLSELSYVCVFEDTKIIVMDQYGNKWIAIERYKEAVGTGISTYEDMYIPRGNFKLLNIIMEYCRTELEDREEEKKYWLKTHNSFNALNRHLIYSDIYHGFVLLGVNDESNAYIKAQFTQKEIDAMPFDTNFFIKEEV